MRYSLHGSYAAANDGQFGASRVHCVAPHTDVPVADDDHANQVNAIVTAPVRILLAINGARDGRSRSDARMRVNPRGELHPGAFEGDQRLPERTRVRPDVRAMRRSGDVVQRADHKSAAE